MFSLLPCWFSISVPLNQQQLSLLAARIRLAWGFLHGIQTPFWMVLGNLAQFPHSTGIPKKATLPLCNKDDILKIKDEEFRLTCLENLMQSRFSAPTESAALIRGGGHQRPKSPTATSTQAVHHVAELCGRGWEDKTPAHL